MNRVVSFVEKDVFIIPVQSPLVIAAATATTVIPGVMSSRDEFALRLLQNVGANPLYYAIGSTCSPTNFHGILMPSASLDGNGFGGGNQLNSVSGQHVSVYSILGTSVAITIYKRSEMAPGQGGIINVNQNIGLTNSN